MTSEEHEYVISKKGRLVDLKPFRRNKLPLVWDPDRMKWNDLEVTFGEHVDVVPISDEEAKRFIASYEKPDLHQRRRMDMSDDF